MNFLDEAKIEVAAGGGGNGCMAFRREKFVARGGPSGGDGGDGGSVYLVGDRNLNTLLGFRFQPKLEAQRGRHGEGSNCAGKDGIDATAPVPLGTVIYDLETGELVGEVMEDGQRLKVAQGGVGGRGNARFATPTNRAPRRADPGTPGEERRLRLELKLLADVGLVGLPNAGKSTLISVLSAAKPKIADYPFTTLQPMLGVVSRGPDEAPFVIADLPGLIEGAAEGAGLGHQFLRHVERCRVLVHLVDLSGYSSIPGEDGARLPATADLETVEAELEAFDPGLLERQRLIVGSKLDSADEERRRELRRAAEERGVGYFEISAATHDGLEELGHAIRERLAAARRDALEDQPVVALPPAAAEGD
jgi:GTP-binding protein